MYRFKNQWQIIESKKSFGGQGGSLNSRRQPFQNSTFQCFQQLQWLPWDCQTLEDTGKTKGSWVIAVGDCKGWTIHPHRPWTWLNLSSYKPTFGPRR
jgi:hypothetical protein